MAASGLRELIDAAGIAGRPLRTVVRLLTEGPHTLVSLIRESTVDRRTVEAIVAAIGDDVEVDGSGSMRIVADRVDEYRDVIGYSQLLRTQLADPLAPRLAGAHGWVAELGRLISLAPRGRRALDHVSATAETAVRRALWLDATYDLTGARLLCVGDHDLTSLAVLLVNPGVQVSVVDVDDRVLEFIDGQAEQSGLALRCLYGDLRFGLPTGVHGWADLVFTDPPYTPEGVRLFLARGITGLRDSDRSRLLMAYGYGAGHPALGLKVQQAVSGLHLVYEAVLPNFSQYHGAQAVGSNSDLYVLRPTTRSRPTAERAGREPANIYTHGPQSIESQSVESAGGAPSLGAVFAGGRRGGAVELDLSADPGSWLLRALLAVDAESLSLLVPNNHPDLATEAGQRALAELVGPKYRLRYRRSTPGPASATVEASRVDPESLDPPGRAVRRLLDRPHGKIGNLWREALIAGAAATGTGPLTKNDARAAVRAAASHPEWLDEQLIDLPRHRLAALLPEVAASAGRGAHAHLRG